MLFGEGGSRADRQASLRKRASLLDWVREDMQALQRELGPADRTRVTEYLESVREVPYLQAEGIDGRLLHIRPPA